MVSYRTDLAAFVLDQLDFIECKLKDAYSDAASQKAAIVGAAGTVPQLRQTVRNKPRNSPQISVLRWEETLETPFECERSANF
jgi:hypothetical protein